MLKHKYFIPMMAALLVMSACHKDDEPSDNSFNPLILFKSNAYVSSSVDGNIKTALGYGILNVEAEADADNTDLLVLSSINDVSEDVLKKAYENGKTIAIVNPSKSELDAFKESHEWLDNKFSTDVISDLTFIISFTKQGQAENHIKPEIQGSTAEEISQSYYVYFATWLDGLNNKYIGSVRGYHAIGDGSMESISTHQQVVHKYAMDIKNFEIRKPKAPLGAEIVPDVHDTILVIYDVYMVHVYEGQRGAGDYYGVKMWATIANAGMFGEGQGEIYNKGTVRWSGWYPKAFKAGAHLSTNKTGDKQAPVLFHSDCQPCPNTTIESTEYTVSQEFSITASQTAGVEADDQGKAGPKAEIGLTEGWSWKEEKKRTIQDVTISSQISGSTGQWQMNFNQEEPTIPADFNGFKLPAGDTYRNSMSMWSAWLWYDNSGKDNDNSEPFYFCSHVEADFIMYSYYTTVTDLYRDKYHFENDTIVQLDPIFNSTMGKLSFKNTLKDDMIVYDVTIKENPSGEIVKIYDSPIANGEELTLGYLRDNKTYLVTFKAKATDGKVVNYEYTHYPILKVDRFNPITLDACVEFEPVK